MQLKEHKVLNDDISSQKSRVRDVLSTAKKVLRESVHSDEIITIREKMEDLKDMMDGVSRLSSDRLGILEQAFALAEHFHSSHIDLSSWLDDMERQVSMLAMPALRPDLIAQQQDKNEVNPSTPPPPHLPPNTVSSNKLCFTDVRTIDQ